MYTFFEVIYLLCSAALWALLLFSSIQALFGIKSGLSNVFIFLGSLGLVEAAYDGVAAYAYAAVGVIITGIVLTTIDGDN